MQKLGFLSLEYIAGDKTYWLESDATEPVYCFGFRVIPLSLFEGHPLKPNHIIREADYSEMTRYDDAGVERCMFAHGQHVEAIPFDTDLKAFPKLRWNDAFDALVEAGVSIGDLQGFWHQQLVRASSTAPEWVKRDLSYLVTAYLPEGDDPLYCVMGEDYKPPENPNMVTVHCEDQASFLERLRWFRVYAIRLSASKGEYYLV